MPEPEAGVALPHSRHLRPVHAGEDQLRYRGRTQVGAASFAWGPHDVFVAPSWQPVSHEALEDAVLFSFSDRAAQKALGVWREDQETVS